MIDVCLAIVAWGIVSVLLCHWWADGTRAARCELRARRAFGRLSQPPAPQHERWQQ